MWVKHFCCAWLTPSSSNLFLSKIYSGQWTPEISHHFFYCGSFSTTSGIFFQNFIFRSVEYHQYYKYLFIWRIQLSIIKKYEAKQTSRPVWKFHRKILSEVFSLQSKSKLTLRFVTKECTFEETRKCFCITYILEREIIWYSVRLH